jgi:hypothetical protein
MQYPGKRSSNFSLPASPAVCVSLLFGAIVISGFLARPIDGRRASTDEMITRMGVKLVASRLQQRDDPEIARALKKYDLVRLGRAELKSLRHESGSLCGRRSFRRHRRR